jgi:uncharacterized membrane protein YoaK (UPF0700 family)
MSTKMPPGTPNSPPLGTSARGAVMHGLRRAVIDERDGPLPAMLVALTVLAGVVDAASILALGGVFVATVTGNLVFVGLGIAGARQFAIVTCLLAIGGFVVGALAGGRACRLGRQHRGRVMRDVLHVKLVLAFVVTVIAVASGDNLDRPLSDAIVVLLAMSMGTQLAAIRYLKVPDLMTVVLTLTITGVLTDRGLGWSHPAMLRRFMAVFAFAVGAISGGVLVLYVSVGAALALGLAIIAGVTISAHVAAASTADWTAPR